jgi:hypothetical protein
MNKKKSRSDEERENDTKNGTQAPTNNNYRVRF